MNFELGDLAGAREDLEAAARLTEEDPKVRLALAECRIELGDVAGLDDALGPLPRRPDDLGRYWFLKGRAAQQEGRTDEAARCWREAVAADPRHRAAHYQLGQLLVRLGKSGEAAPFLERAESLRLEGEALKKAVNEQLTGVRDAGACETLGRLCHDAGMPAEGRAWLEQAIRLDPTRAGAQAALARLGSAPGPGPGPPEAATGGGGHFDGLACRGHTARRRPTVRGRGRASGPDLRLRQRRHAATCSSATRWVGALG